MLRLATISSLSVDVKTTILRATIDIAHAVSCTKESRQKVIQVLNSLKDNPQLMDDKSKSSIKPLLDELTN